MHRQLARVWMDISSHSPICSQGAPPRVCVKHAVDPWPCEGTTTCKYHTFSTQLVFYLEERGACCCAWVRGWLQPCAQASENHRSIARKQTLARRRAAHTVKWSQPWPCEGTTPIFHSDFAWYMKYMTPGTPVVRRVDARVRAWLQP